MSRLTVLMKPTKSSTRVLARIANIDLLKANLPSPRKNTHAAALLLESLAKWYGQPAFTVVYADGWEYSSGLDLCDGFGFGTKTEYFDVEIHNLKQRYRLGPFADLRRLVGRGVR